MWGGVEKRVSRLMSSTRRWAVVPLPGTEDPLMPSLEQQAESASTCGRSHDHRAVTLCIVAHRRASSRIVNQGLV